jgi:hypothetical protein
MTDERSKLPPGREPLHTDWFVEQLGASQQKVMHLTIQNRQLEKLRGKAEHRAEVLEELIMDVVADLREGVKDSEIEARIAKVMQGLEGYVE